MTNHQLPIKTMFRKILVATDSSESSQQIFDQALDLAKAMGARLMLLHVLSSEEEGSPKIAGAFSNLEFYPEVIPQIREEIIISYRQQWSEFETTCLEMLRDRTITANTAGVEAEFTQNPGNPAKTICEMAKNWQADLIIIGRRGRTGLSELLLGSVSNYVIHHAPCAVLTVQPTNSQPKTNRETQANALI